MRYCIAFIVLSFSLSIAYSCLCVRSVCGSCAMDSSDALNTIAPSRGRPRKEADELSIRSLRRRIREDFVPPSRPPSLQNTPSLDTCTSAENGGDDSVVFETSWTGMESADSETGFCPVDEPPNNSEHAGSVLQPSKLTNDSAPQDDFLFDDNEEQHDEGLDEHNFDATILGALHYDCDVCINCQCIGCGICSHFEDDNCVHCEPCACDSTSEAGDDALQDGDVGHEEECGVVILTEEDRLYQDMRSDLVQVCLKNDLSHTAINDILGFFRKYDIGKFPQTAKTLLKTPLSVQLRDVPPGEYWHNGLTKHLIKHVTETQCSVIDITFSTDGVPLFKSTSQSFWPLTCLLNNHPEVYVIGLYLGKEKPADCNVYFADFVEEVVPLCENGLNVSERIVKVNVVRGIFDAPATCFALNTKSFNAYFGCFKCTTEGEMVNSRMCYPQLDAPLRTNESFLNQEQGSYHKGKTILADIPRFGCVTSVPLDYMHLILLGLMRKLMYMWIGGPYNVRVGAGLVKEISSVLVSVTEWLPCEFTRRTLRTLHHIKRFKATEFRLILLYIGVILFIKLPRHLYQHFLVFHVLTTIFIDRSFCQSSDLLEYAQELSIFFVETFIELYGRQYVSHNVHCLIHLAEDVKRFGALDDFGAFPFENSYRFLGKFVRKGEKPLEQTAKRLLELEANGCKIYNVKEQPNSFQGGGVHGHGILLDECMNPQFHFLTLPGGYTLSTRSEADNCCIIDKFVVLVKNFASNSKGEILVIGNEFLVTDDVYDYPCRSSVFGIMFVRKPSQLKVWPASQILRKCFRMPWKNGFVVFPLHKH